MKFYNFFLLYVMIMNIVFSNVLKARSQEKVKKETLIKIKFENNKLKK